MICISWGFGTIEKTLRCWLWWDGSSWAPHCERILDSNSSADLLSSLSPARYETFINSRKRQKRKLLKYFNFKLTFLKLCFCCFTLWSSCFFPTQPQQKFDKHQHLQPCHPCKWALRWKSYILPRTSPTSVLRCFRNRHQPGCRKVNRLGRKLWRNVARETFFFFKSDVSYNLMKSCLFHFKPSLTLVDSFWHRNEAELDFFEPSSKLQCCCDDDHNTCSAVSWFINKTLSI